MTTKNIWAPNVGVKLLTKVSRSTVFIIDCVTKGRLIALNVVIFSYFKLPHSLPAAVTVVCLFKIE